MKIWCGIKAAVFTSLHLSEAGLLSKGMNTEEEESTTVPHGTQLVLISPYVWAREVYPVDPCSTHMDTSYSK